MNLSNERIQELVKKPANSISKQRGIKHHQRLSMHVDTVLSKEDAGIAHREFLGWVQSILTQDKYKQFERIFNQSFPLPTNELAQKIFSELLRVFEAQDYFEKYSLVKEELEKDFHDYREKVLKQREFIQNDIWQAVQTGIDNVLVVDMPAEPSTKEPQPYAYIIPIDSIVDIVNSKDGKCEYLIFVSGEKLIVYDDTYFRVYGYKDKRITPLPVAEIEHGLGYTPARSIWSDNLKIGNTVNKKNPITKELGELSWFLFHEISKKYLDMYASYPIYITYETDNDFDQPNSDVKPLEQSDQLKDSGLIGAGSNLTVPAPQTKDDPDLLSNPIKVISADIDSLEYNVKESERLADKIFKACVGSDEEVAGSQAKNELQVKSSFESRENILTRIGKNLATIQLFMNETIARLRYGNEYYIGGVVSYGNRFHLQSENDLMKDYSFAKDNGAGVAILDSINSQVIQAKYKDNHEAAERARIINDLDPLPQVSNDEISDLLTAGLINAEDAKIKVNLMRYVRRFEIENLPLCEFGKDSTYQKKIETITNQFKVYASEQKPGI